MHDRAKELLKQGDGLFSKRMPLLSLWQHLGDMFYPERAHFTRATNLGEEFADHLTTSFPMMVRRELGNTFASMLRPSGQPWMSITVGEDEADHAGKMWLQWATKKQRRAMYDRPAQFVRATKEADHDFATFGNAVISVELNPRNNALLYRNWHLRDCVWTEGVDGAVSDFHRKWTVTIAELVQLFGLEKLDPKLRDKYERDPYCEVNCRHIVIPAERYAGEVKYLTRWVSIYVDTDHQHIMQERGARHHPYVVPRWQTVSGSQYAFSPATIIALPDARLIQDMTLTLLDAGQRAAIPPLIASDGNAIRGDIDVRSGQVTWIDRDYDDRMGAPLEALNIDGKGLPYGMDMLQDIREQLRKAFYADKLTMPGYRPEMTAFEVAQWVEQYIRDALPLFEPVESDYNGGLCERTFEICMDAGLFGSPDQIPPSLAGRDVEFKFESPLRQAADKQKAALFKQGAEVLQIAAMADPTLARIARGETIVRATLEGLGWDTEWLESPEVMQQVREAAAQQAQAQQQMAMAQQASEVAKNVGATV